MHRLSWLLMFLMLAGIPLYSPSATVLPNKSGPKTIYEIAESVTGTSVEILLGIAFAESSYRETIAHPDPLDVGLFGLHEAPEYHAERAKKWGEYDAADPQQAAIIAGYLYQENLRLLGDPDLAIAAHLQGPTGVRRHGPAQWYIDRVRGAP